MRRVNLGCEKKAPRKRKLAEGCPCAEVVLDFGPEKKKRHHEKEKLVEGCPCEEVVLDFGTEKKKRHQEK